MKVLVATFRTFLALAVCAAIGVGGVTLAHHTGKGQVKVTQLSQRDIVEKLDGKDASATVVVMRRPLSARPSTPVRAGSSSKNTGQWKT